MAAAWLFWVILGGLVGGFVKSVAWFESDRGWAPCLLFGIVGGVLGGYLSTLAGGTNGFELADMGVCTLGAAILLIAYSVAPRRVSKMAAAEHERRAA